MASTAHTGKSLECDYLHSHTSPIPHVFPSKQAELVHINEQISSLDHHISQLNSCQLHNLLLPIHTLPIEVLSHIFQQSTDRKDHNHTRFKEYRKCLHQAFVLSSVSVHFRHVAFCTPELWRRIPLEMTVGGEMGQLVSLLWHCMTFAHIVDVSVYDRFDDEEDARSAIQTPGLFTFDVTRRIKSFELIPFHRSDVWQPIFKGSSFPMLDNLSIWGLDLTFDLGTLSTVTRLEIHKEDPACQIIMPPSVRYLFLENAAPEEFISMLFQCPNLEECLARDTEHCQEDEAAQLDRPLTLTHLKRLTLSFGTVIMTPSLAQNLRLPSLEYLQLKRCDVGEFDGFLLFCHNVSATLTTLKVELVGRTLAYYHLHELCRLSLPNLRKLGIVFSHLAILRGAIYALTKRVEECSKGQTHYLPSLAALTLCYDDYLDGKINPRWFLDLLETWRIGETSYFHLKIKERWYFGDRDWLPKVEEELRSVVGNRQIGITWNGNKVH